jgi:aryl-alcohol dehydrogenase-like predicted oxidoreductase
MDQLKANIDAKDVTLSDAVLEELEEIHKVYTYPCP